ncbi:MAG: SGNH/GDSL hydrolase family protein [Propionibacteriaceae bacterium]
MSVYVVGDSLTAGNGQVLKNGKPHPDSWVGYLPEEVVVEGTWAVSGATTEDMAEGVSASAAEILVIMAAENDYDNGISMIEIAANLDLIVKEVGSPQVLIVGATPTDYDPETAKRLNWQLREYADDRGYDYVDGGRDVRNTNGDWLPGMSDDGVHPTAAAARVIAKTIMAGIHR